MSMLSELLSSAHGSIRGAHLAPIYQYPLDGYAKRLRGRTCVFLGKEKNNRYWGRFNFFGGSIGRKDQGDPIHGLIREVAEELCIKITPTKLEQSLLKARLIERQGGKYHTLLVFVHITGLRRKLWRDTMQERHRQRAPANQQEMTDASHFALDELTTRKDLSSYVQQYIPLLQEAAHLMSSENAVPVSALETVVRPDQVELFE